MGMDWATILAGLGAGATSVGQSMLAHDAQQRDAEALKLARMAAGFRTEADIGPDAIGKMNATPAPAPGVAMPGGRTANFARPSAGDVTPASAAQATPAMTGGSLPQAASSPAALARVASQPTTQGVQDRYTQLGEAGGQNWFYDAEGSVEAIQGRREAEAAMAREKELLDYGQTLADRSHFNPRHQEAFFNTGISAGVLPEGSQFEPGRDYEHQVPGIMDYNTEQMRAQAALAQSRAAEGRAAGGGATSDDTDAVTLDTQMSRRRQELTETAMIQNWSRWRTDPAYQQAETDRIEAQVQNEFAGAIQKVYGRGPGQTGGGNEEADGGGDAGESAIPPTFRASLDIQTRGSANVPPATPDDLRGMYPNPPESTWVEAYIRENNGGVY